MKQDRFTGADGVRVRIREAGRRIEIWTVDEDERGDETIGPSCYLDPASASALAFELSAWAALSGWIGHQSKRSVIRVGKPDL
jgi:hypothetical protein